MVSDGNVQIYPTLTGNIVFTQSVEAVRGEEIEYILGVLRSGVCKILVSDPISHPFDKQCSSNPWIRVSSDQIVAVKSDSCHEVSGSFISGFDHIVDQVLGEQMLKFRDDLDELCTDKERPIRIVRALIRQKGALLCPMRETDVYTCSKGDIVGIRNIACKLVIPIPRRVVVRRIGEL